MNYYQHLVLMPVYALASAALSMFLTWFCVILLPYFNMVDVPRGRHQHARPVPVGGGIAMIVTFTVIMGCFFWQHDRGALAGPMLLQFGPPMLAITILGLCDDRFELRSFIKLLVQVLVGIYFYYSGVAISNFLGYPLPEYLALPVTVCWVIGIINAFNLIDGMDGVAAGLAAIAAFSMAVWQVISHEQVLSVASLMIFCGACIGFLRYNFSPARIFMGDTGSMFIGLFFAYFSIAESAKAVTFTSLLVPVLAMGVPLFDVFLAITRRLYRRYIMKMQDVGIMTGDHDHLHHRLQAMLKNPRKTAYYLYMLAAVMALGAMSAALVSDLMRTLSFGILLLVTFVVIRSATIEFYDAAALFANGVHLPHRKLLLTAAHPVMDIMLLLTAYVMTTLIFQWNITFCPFTLKQALCCIAPYTIILSFSGLYRTYWLRVGITRFYKLMVMLVLSGVIVLALTLALTLLEFGRNEDQLSLMREFCAVYIMLGGILIVSERFFLYYMETFGFKRLELGLVQKQQPVRRTIIYGGGRYCRMLLTSLFSASNVTPDCMIVGLLDDNSNLRGLNVFGLDVLGGCDDLPQILQQRPFDEIVIAFRDITPEMRQKLIQFGKDNGIAVREFHYGLNTLQEK